jgi:hypothetical protein
MKIKSNVRAGSQTQKRSSSTDSTSSQINNTVVTYVAPVSRCVGI